MLTILSETVQRAGYRKQVSHIVWNFHIPDFVLNLLEILPLAISIGIKNDILIPEDTLSLLAGHSVQLCGFVELVSFLVYVGWGNGDLQHALRACHHLGMRSQQESLLHRRCLGETLGPDQPVAPGVCTYQRKTWMVGMDNRDRLPALGSFSLEPDGILYLTRMSQEQFLCEFNKFILELLVGTEVNYQRMAAAGMSEEVAQSLYYRTETGTISLYRLC